MKITAEIELGLALFLSAVFFGCYETQGPADGHEEGIQPVIDLPVIETLLDDSSTVNEVLLEETLEPPDGFLPVCSRHVTYLWANADGICSGAWIHGEQKCPDVLWCGYSVSWCNAFVGWPEGSCICPEPSENLCCPLEFLEPTDGALLTQEDDVRYWQLGLQISIRVQVNCWDAADVDVFVCSGPGTEPSQPEVLEPDGEDVGTAVLNLGEAASGCIDLCAQIVAESIDLVIMSEEITVCVNET